jgi:uridine kinase
MVLVIGISGVTSCGKEELARNLKGKLDLKGHIVEVVGQDAFDTQANLEQTDTIDFGRLVAAVSTACGRSEVVIVEGSRAFHESGYLVNESVRLTDSMHVRLWLEISKEACYNRGMAEGRITDTFFHKTLWPQHMKYKTDVFVNETKKVANSSFFQISSEQTTGSILQQAMAKVEQLLYTHATDQRKGSIHHSLGAAVTNVVIPIAAHCHSRVQQGVEVVRTAGLVDDSCNVDSDDVSDMKTLTRQESIQAAVDMVKERKGPGRAASMGMVITFSVITVGLAYTKLQMDDDLRCACIIYR